MAARKTMLGLLAIPAAAGAGAAAFSAMAARKVEQFVKMDGRQETMPDGQVLHVTDHGSGPAVLLIHGLSGQMRNLTGAMSAHLEGMRVVAIDRPGSGYSPRSASVDASLRVQARAVAGLIDRLKLERPVLVGHSLGGALALQVALDHPASVGGLALIAPVTAVQRTPPSMLWHLAVPSKILRQLVAWTLAVPYSAWRGKRVTEAVFAPEPVPKKFGTVFGGLLGGRPENYRNASADLIASVADMTAIGKRLGSLSCPVAILYGTEDAVLSHRRHGIAMREQIPGLELELVPGGHMLPVTQPTLCAEFVRRLQQRVGSG